MLLTQRLDSNINTSEKKGKVKLAQEDKQYYNKYKQGIKDNSKSATSIFARTDGQLMK